LWNKSNLRVKTANIDLRAGNNIGGLASAQLNRNLNPRTGQPLRGTSNSAVVAHKSGSDADAWATAFFVLSNENAEAAILREGLNVLFLKNNGSETLCIPYGTFA
jgi:thiamine biosynthesis lipoprotein ApbE|tara:strand:+ start:10317 stop:10631 length:315 start_codon:yes stop_codon:yes gene_type:complete